MGTFFAFHFSYRNYCLLKKINLAYCLLKNWEMLILFLWIFFYKAIFSLSTISHSPLFYDLPSSPLLPFSYPSPVSRIFSIPPHIPIFEKFLTRGGQGSYKIRLETESIKKIVLEIGLENCNVLLQHVRSFLDSIQRYRYNKRSVKLYNIYFSRLWTISPKSVCFHISCKVLKWVCQW